MCALRGRQPGQSNVRAFLRCVAPYKGVPPLRCHGSYPSALCSGNSLLAQSIFTAKPENSISSRRPSTENVGGLFLSNYLIKSKEVNHAKTEKPCRAECEERKIEQQLAQERHKIHRLENRAAYYEKGDRRKRAHHLITRGAAIESIAPLTKALTETEFYAFAEKVFDLPEVKGLLMEAVNEHNRAEQKEGC